VLKETFPNVEVRYLKWPPTARDVFSKRKSEHREKRPGSRDANPGILEMVKEFDPEIIITHFAPVTGEVMKRQKAWKLSAACGEESKILMSRPPARGISLFLIIRQNS